MSICNVRFTEMSKVSEFVCVFGCCPFEAMTQQHKVQRPFKQCAMRQNYSSYLSLDILEVRVFQVIRMAESPSSPKLCRYEWGRFGRG